MALSIEMLNVPSLTELFFEQMGYFKDLTQDNVRHLLESLFYRANISKPTADKIKAMFNRIHVLQKGKGYGYKIGEKENK